MLGNRMKQRFSFKYRFPDNEFHKASGLKAYNNTPMPWERSEIICLEICRHDLPVCSHKFNIFFAIRHFIYPPVIYRRHGFSEFVCLFRHGNMDTDIFFLK